ncbi:N-acetylmuramoyl-L-alanine amidase [Reinekea marinisedimentorum]|uniref:N-acetylmuramoyl-L-alanine amidase AmiC n=1 Tax=Reinekea marinisedimentorum TaxID=230495 RepID=A0A4R3IAJ0_9GAMM|nr:N-acetylmuramoyl-L-alanine amidase [Reinekea marinisedimentorum]TCS42994.1 N-acetylmuramoyl-L-alanine amidase [Reinekea marinisedimentorum]
MKFGVTWLLLLVLSVSSHAAIVNGVRVWPAPDNTRLVFDLDQPAEHTVLVLKNPFRVVLDVKGAQLKTDFSDLDLANTGISRIRSAVRNQNDLRIVLDMSSEMTPRSFALKPNDQYGDRLVLDLERSTLADLGLDSSPQVRQSVSKTLEAVNSLKRDVIVVIDAGHGGEDPGAIGPKKLREKNVVLAMAKELYDQLDALPGYKPIMTRTGDYIVALKKRSDFARQNNADLFISIHADAYRLPSAQGASVFALSNGGSVSAMAKYLADKENASDVIGGINGVSLEDKDDTLKSVLVDLSMTSTLQRSVEVGALVLAEIGRFTKLHGDRRSVGHANFVVLRAPDVPSILVESGFISNPREEANLGSAAYRKKMATAIKNGVVKYFEQTPPDGSYIAWAQQQKNTTKKYTVAKGDTLSGIAARNGVSVNRIIAVNNLSGTSIRIGQVLLIPGA